MPRRKTQEEYIKKAMDVHHNKYIYSKTIYINANAKVDIICPIHGLFSQCANSHLRGMGCGKCGDKQKGRSLVRKKADEFISKSILKHGDKYDYSQVRYNGNKNSVNIICKIHGVFKQLPNAHLGGSGCPCCAGNVRETTDSFIKKAIKIHGDRYDYSLAVYKTNKEEVAIICKKHGIFHMRPDSHTNSKQGCSKCYFESRTKTTDDFILRSNIIHNNKFDYSKTIYKHANSKVLINCPLHGDFYQVARHHLRGRGCPLCRISKGEERVKFFLDKNNIEYTCQKKITKIKPYNLLRFDFYLPFLNTLIEYQGQQHYYSVDYFGGNRVFVNQKRIDNDKAFIAKTNGYNFIIIPYWEFSNIDAILTKELMIVHAR